jgi:hypothetical protein
MKSSFPTSTVATKIQDTFFSIICGQRLINPAHFSRNPKGPGSQQIPRARSESYSMGSCQSEYSHSTAHNMRMRTEVFLTRNVPNRFGPSFYPGSCRTEPEWDYK